MERLTQLSRSLQKALTSFSEALQMEYSAIVRDATIQRFEFTFVLFWKLLKEYLNIQEGIICSSPKSCIREGFRQGLFDEQQTVLALEMVDDRNLTSHTYDESMAERIYHRAPSYYGLMQITSSEIERKVAF